MKNRVLTCIPAALIALSACGGPDTDERAAEVPPPTIEESAPRVPADGAAPVLPEEPAETSATPSNADCTVMSADGFCNVTFGMTETEVRDAYEGDLIGDMTENTSCYYLRTGEDNYNVLFMIAEGTMQRIDIRDASVSSNAGAAVGMPLDEVEALYDTTSRTPNKYNADIEVLKVELGDGVFGIFEEGEDGTVRAWRYGVEPAVSSVEGCA